MDLPDIFEKRAKKLLIHRIRLEYSNETSFLLHKLITVYIYYFDSVPKTGNTNEENANFVERYNLNYKTGVGTDLKGNQVDLELK